MSPPRPGSAPPPALADRALAATQSGIVMSDATHPDAPLLYVNGAFETLTGYAADECLGRNCRFLQGPRTDRGVVAALSVALREGREAHVVLLNHRKDGTPFHNELRVSPVRDDDGRIVQFVGVQNDVTEMVRGHRALEAEREEALTELRVFQDALSPGTIPARPHLELASVFLAAEHGVSGDFHLVTPGPGGTTVIVVGDAMGHGLEAARHATFVRTTIASFTRFTDDPRRLLELANQALIERAGVSACFVTAVCVTYDPALRRLRWASAGHPAPLALDDGRPIGTLDQVGIALGIAPELGGTGGETRLLPGDGVLLSTDGLAEARATAPHPVTPQLGTDRVREVVRRHRGASPARVVEALRAAAHEHTGGHLSDDLCLVAARAE